MTQESYMTLFEKYRDQRLINKYEQYARWTVASVFTKNFKSDLRGNEIL